MAIKFRYNNANYSLNEQSSAIAANNLVYYSGGAKKYCPALPTRGTKVLVKTEDSGKTYIDNSSPSICFKKNGTVYYCAKSSIFSSKSTIKYDANGGSGFMSSQEWYPNDGETVTIKECQFTRSGYSFVNWNTYPNGRGTPYYAGSSPRGYDGTLYAQWELSNTTIPAGTYSPSSFESLIKSFISIGGSRKLAADIEITLLNTNSSGSTQIYNAKAGNTVLYNKNSSSLWGYPYISFDGSVYEPYQVNSSFSEYGTYIVNQNPNSPYFNNSYQNFYIILKEPMSFL